MLSPPHPELWSHSLFIGNVDVFSFLFFCLDTDESNFSSVSFGHILLSLYCSHHRNHAFQVHLVYTMLWVIETSEAHMKPNQTKTINAKASRHRCKTLCAFPLSETVCKPRATLLGSVFDLRRCSECEKQSRAACLNTLVKEISYLFHILAIWQPACGCKAMQMTAMCRQRGFVHELLL